MILVDMSYKQHAQGVSTSGRSRLFKRVERGFVAVGDPNLVEDVRKVAGDVAAPPGGEAGRHTLIASVNRYSTAEDARISLMHIYPHFRSNRVLSR